jgi:hypothetical protein
VEEVLRGLLRGYHTVTRLPVQWGEIDRHPFRDQVRLDGDLALRPRTRYVVAFRDVRLASGDKAPPAPGFAKLRDRTAEEPALLAIRDRFDAEVFGPLEKAGVKRSQNDDRATRTPVASARACPSCAIAAVPREATPSTTTATRA